MINYLIHGWFDNPRKCMVEADDPSLQNDSSFPTAPLQ